MRNSILGVVAISTLIAACACSGTHKPAAPPAVPQAPEEKATLQPSNSEITPTRERLESISISDRIREACGIRDSETFFGYNSSRVSADTHRVLRQLADCFASGPLQGEQMNLVGHTDPRGAEEYNLSLGGRRAESVKRLLGTMGLQASRVVTTSRGEMDAQGDDEQSWVRDRKVDIRTVN